ncbi:hypothetical protein ACLOJK_034001 [Asimina triloba]
MASHEDKRRRGEADQILVEERGCLRTLTLNRPQQLNAMSYQMLQQIWKLFIEYEEDPNVKLVILKGKGRAFCAGGDVLSMAHFVNDGRNFFSCSPQTYRDKDVTNVSLLDGFVMGGGGGLSIHGKFRVATENTSLDTCDYLFLTGARLDGAEMLSCGLATHFVSSKKLPLLEEALVKVDKAVPATVCSIIDEFSQHAPLKETSVLNRTDVIDRCFSRRTVEEILSTLEQEATRGPDEWIAATIQTLKKASPTSLKVSLRSIREGRLQSVGQCLIREYRICCHVFRGEVSRDFFEGCRAVLLDKDKNPKWEPSKLDLVGEKMVDQYFSRVDDEEWKDLKLPTRSNLAVSAVAKL